MNQQKVGGCEYDRVRRRFGSVRFVFGQATRSGSAGGTAERNRESAQEHPRALLRTALTLTCRRDHGFD